MTTTLETPVQASANERAAESFGKSIDKLIQSGEKLAVSNDRHSKAMVLLTSILVLTASVQVGIAYFTMRHSRQQVAREHSLRTVSSLLETLETTQEIYLNPQHYRNVDQWKAQVQAATFELRKSYGAALLVLTKEEGELFAEFTVIQGEFLQAFAANVGPDGTLRPSFRKLFSDRFDGVTQRLALVSRKRLGIDEVSGPSGLK